MISSINKRDSKRQPSGQSIAEIAIALPFLIMIVFALVEMGLAFASFLSLVNAAREGAIFASQCPSMQSSSNDASTTCTNSGGTMPNIQMFRDRINNDIVDPLGGPLVASQLQVEDTTCNNAAYDNSSNPWVYYHCLSVDRPVTDSCGLSVGCPITTTVHYRLKTFSSSIAVPYFGRFGLPDYYQINYSVGMPIRRAP